MEKIFKAKFHPEAGDDEVFLTNASINYFIKSIGWRTKRLGKTPIDLLHGTTNRRTDRAGVSGVSEPLKSRFASITDSNLFPVFVKRAELEADGYNIKNERSVRCGKKKR